MTLKSSLVEGDYVFGATPLASKLEIGHIVKTMLAITVKGAEYDRDALAPALARHLGFSQATPALRRRMKTAFNAAIRRGYFERTGNKSVRRVT
jgi:hypothetical protein